MPQPIVRVITRLNVGGPARQALLLSRHLAEDYPTQLIAGTAAPEEGELEDPEVNLRRVPLVRNPHPIHDVQSFLLIRRLLSGSRLVHSHMAKAGALARLAASSIRPRPKIVHTFHGHVLQGYFSPRVQSFYIQLERKLARLSDCLVAVSPEVRDELLDLRIGTPHQYRVISLGFELEPFFRTPQSTGTIRAHFGLSAAVPLVGIVGRLAPIKDHEQALLALRPLAGAHLAIVGDGERREALERRVRELDMEERVHFAGWQTEMADVMADLDVVILTSRNEGTPVSLIEASAAGKPVVSTNVGGVRSVVEHEVSGFLCTSGDVNCLSFSIHRLLSDPLLRSTMGDAGRKRVQQRFGLPRLLRDVRSLYAELLHS